MQAQGKPPIKIQIMAIFLKKNNFNSKLSHFQIKNILVKNSGKIISKFFEENNLKKIIYNQQESVLILNASEDLRQTTAILMKPMVKQIEEEVWHCLEI